MPLYIESDFCGIFLCRFNEIFFILLCMIYAFLILEFSDL